MTDAGAGTLDRLHAQASRQAGIISRQQALTCGATHDAIAWAVRRGTWQRIHPGIYATFSGPVSRSARLWAALLYSGKDAILSYETAAELLGLTDRSAAGIHVTIPHTRKVSPSAGLIVHSSRRVLPKWRFAGGIPPHTMPEDTVLDLVNAAKSLDEAAGWVTAAFARRLTGEWPLRQAMAQRPRLRWRAQIGEVVTLAADGVHSVLEFRYDRDVERAHGLPPARRQAPFAKRDGSRGYRDRYYEQYGRLVIELDGREYHPDTRRDHDRRRDNQAAAGGGSTLRYDWAAVTRRPCETAAEVYAAVRERGYRGTIRPCSPACQAVSEGGVRHPAVAGARPRA